LCPAANVSPRGEAHITAQDTPEGAAEGLDLPPAVLAEVREGLDRIFHGDPDAALPIAHSLESGVPDHPIGYLLEAEARWWKIYCGSCGIRFNLIDAWSRAKLAEDSAYFATADRAIQLATAQIAQHETATLHVFAGMGYGLKARLYGLRGEKLAVARSGVKGREHFLRALKLQPGMGDALTGIGLYNYLADVLSPLAKMLRFFMGIPGGNKKEGIRQLEMAMNTAELTAAEARFYLARNLRNFDQKYERGAELLEPLVAQYPENPSFQLLLGNMYARLDRKEQAAAHFHAALNLHSPDAACAARSRELATAALAALDRGSEKP
jgi:tetratricopeptide (TPR) repeat protein